MGKVAIVGSRRLDLAHVAGALLTELLALPEGTEVLLRKPRTTDPEAFEELTSRLCERLEYPVTWMEPREEDGEGRAQTFQRDIRMAEAADYCIAFFAPEAIMSGGTGHVVEKFADIEKAAYAYTVDDNKRKIRVGEYEPAKHQ